jgi:glycosyltransferase involved in cell wall biosynthesis
VTTFDQITYQKMLVKLLLVVPCYNEEAVLPITYPQFSDFLRSQITIGAISDDSMVCFVDDGSRDKTWELIQEYSAVDNQVMGVKLSRNCGHQNAILAGLLENKDNFDCYVTIDADLQDNVNAVADMIAAYKEGAAVVYGVRNDRTSDSWFKRTTAEGFYKMMQKMGVPVIFNHADFRLIDNRVLNELEGYKEVNLFIRGIIPTIGFKSKQVFYKRLEREAGESKYPLGKMIIFAWNGVTSFSTFPMRVVLWFGVLNFFVALSIGMYVVVSKMFGITVAGWTSIVLPMAFFSGSNMIAIGLIGEYIGKIYQEVKQRPRYIIEEHLNEV